MTDLTNGNNNFVASGFGALIALVIFLILNFGPTEQRLTQEKRVAEARRYRVIHTTQINQMAQNLFGHQDYGLIYTQRSSDWAIGQLYDRRKGVMIRIECYEHNCRIIARR